MQRCTHLHTQKFHKDTKSKTKMYKQKICKSADKAWWERKKAPKILEFDFWGPSTVGHGPCLWLWFVNPVRMPLEKTNFSFLRSCQLEIAYGLRMAACVPFSSQCWDCAWLEPVRVLCAVIVSVSSYVNQSCCVQKTLFHWSRPSPVTLIILPPPLSLLTFLSPGGGFDKDIPFRIERSKISYSVYCSVVDEFVLVYCKRKLL